MEFKHLLIFVAGLTCIVYKVNSQDPRTECIAASKYCTDQGITQDCSSRELTTIPCQFSCATQILNLAQNSFSILPGNVFNGECLTQTLRVLDLSGNSISHIELAFFRRLDALQFVFLGDNNLQSLRQNIFDGNPALQELHLQNNEFVVAPQLQGTSTTLSKLYLGGNMIQALEDGQFGYLNNLQHLDLSSNSIETFTKYTFENLTKLQVLDLSANSFSVLPDYGFSLLVSLKSLFIKNHKMVNINANWFKQSQTLTELNLQDGLLSDITDNTFKYLTSLERLVLQSNKLTMLRRRMFFGLIRLTYLDLSGNKLTMVGSPFSEMQALEQLDLSYNQLTVIEPDMFKGIETLHALNLENNLLEDVGNTLSILPLLYYIDLSSNQIANLSSNAFTGNSKIEDIQLNENQFKDIPSAILEAGDLLRGSLKILGLRGNLISIVHSDSFGQLTKLEDLDLRDNSVERCEANSFIKLPALSKLYLSGNHLTTMHKASLDSNSKLTNVYLDGNPWICDCDVLGLWTHLNLTGVNVVGKEDVLCMIPGQLDKRRVMDISVDPSYDCRGNTGLTETHIIVMAIGVAAIFLVIIVILLIVVIHYKRKDSKRKKSGRSHSIPNAYEDGYMTPSVTHSINSSSGAPHMTPSMNGSASRDNSRSNFKREESHKYDIPYAVQDYTPMRSSVVPPTPLKPKLYKSRRESEGYLEPSEIGSSEDLYRINSRKESELSDGYTDPMELDTSNDTYSFDKRQPSDGYIQPIEIKKYKR